MKTSEKSYTKLTINKINRMFLVHNKAVSDKTIFKTIRHQKAKEVIIGEISDHSWFEKTRTNTVVEFNNLAIHLHLIDLDATLEEVYPENAKI
ncbi:MAG: hypothetical protein ACRC6X_04855 [Culicoidibacterales bacterium]